LVQDAAEPREVNLANPERTDASDRRLIEQAIMQLRNSTRGVLGRL
jgi:hypothetical protein